MMRLLESDLDDTEDQPYYEGEDHLCRNCGRQMLPNRQVYCLQCRYLMDQSSTETDTFEEDD